MRGSIKLGVIAVSIMLSVILLSIYNFCHSQSLSDKVVGRYDINKKRLLAISTGLNLYMVSQGQIDIDSSMLLSCDAYKFSRLFPYNEGYDNGSASLGKSLIDSGKIDEAKQLLSKVKNEDRIRLALELGTYYLFKPGTNQADLNQSLFYIQQAKKDADLSGIRLWKNESLSLLGRYYLQTGDIQTSQRYFSQVVQANILAKDKKATALATANQAINLPITYPDKLPLLQKSQELCKKAGLKEKEIEVVSNIIIEYFISNWDAAKEKFQENMALQRAIGFAHTHLAESGISFLEHQQGNFIQGLTHALQAVKTMEQTGDTKFSSLYYPRLASSYFIVDRKEGLYYYKRGLDNKTKETQVFWYKNFLAYSDELIAFEGPANTLKYINQTVSKYPPATLFDRTLLAAVQGRCYAALKQKQKAIYYFDLFTRLAEQIPAEHVHSEVIFYLIDIADFYSKMGDQVHAKLYISKVLPLLKGKGKLKYSAPTLDLVLFRLDSLNGDYLSAIRNYQRYNHDHDSIITQTSTRQLNFLQIQFETKNKDQSINLLTQQSQLQKAKLEQADFFRNVTIGGIFMLLVIVGLLYNQYRVKQRSNEQLQIKQDEISRKNSSLENLLEEKEWLLKEVHHRVKNNLHTIMSLLESQSAYLSDDALLAIHDSQHRIHAMSLIHQKLYTSDDVTTIEMSTYIQELTSYLRDSFIDGQDIRFQLDVERIELDVAQAIPLGLILNEAITNSLKYAFPGNRTGLISITFKQLNDELFKLSVEDNGIGLKPNFNTEKVSSLGMKLMRGLSNEIHADLQISSQQGTTISLTFSSKQVVPDRHIFSLNQG